MIYALVVLAVVSAAVANAKLYTESQTHQSYLWSSFKRDFRKQYSTPEVEQTRFAAFVDNLKLIDERNAAEQAAGGNARHGLTQFMDLTQGEFAKLFLGSNKEYKTSENRTMDDKPVVEVAAGQSMDWTGVYTTPVKNQGYCGSCWAFSATEQIESDSMRTLGTDYILSPEQITQCAPIAQGCGGGWTEVAYGYVKSSGGLETDAEYPYTSYYGVTGTCHANKADGVVALTGYTTIGGSSTSAIETAMASYVLSTGPLSVCLDANNWSSYTGGIMSVCGQQVDHCVQAVGVDTSSTGGYWKVRNSWGTDWGESGYIQLAYGANTCDITNDATWTTVKLA